MANKSQTGLGLVDKSTTMTGSPVLVVAEDDGRGGLLMMNCAAHDILFVFSPLGAGTTAPTITAGAAGVYCLAAASAAGKQGGSYEPDAGYIPTNAIWAQGTNADILVCHVSQP